jgi:hypothetical protein
MFGNSLIVLKYPASTHRSKSRQRPSGGFKGRCGHRIFFTFMTILNIDENGLLDKLSICI